MILAKIKHLSGYLPKYGGEIMKFVYSLSADTPDGGYPIIGETVFARVMSYQTKPAQDCEIEAHRKYVDVQSTLSGVEGIGIFGGLSSVKTPYSAEKDVVFYNTAEPLYTAAVHEGYFAVIFTDEPHRPQTAVGGKIQKIKKFVIKIDKELWQK